jgi:hypothetical protein
VIVLLKGSMGISSERASSKIQNQYFLGALYLDWICIFVPGPPMACN